MSSNFASGFGVPPGAQVASGGQAQALNVFLNGARTDQAQVGPDGHPLYRLTALVMLPGQPPIDGELRFEFATEPPELPGGMVTLPSGTTVTVMGPRKGGYGLTLQLLVPTDKVSALFGTGSSSSSGIASVTKAS